VARRAGAAVAALRASEAKSGVIPGEVGHLESAVRGQGSEVRGRRCNQIPMTKHQ
jgi:hypothetical protein